MKLSEAAPEEAMHTQSNIISSVPLMSFKVWDHKQIFFFTQL